MVDSSGQAEIRGIDIDTLAKGFADEATIFKSVPFSIPAPSAQVNGMGSSISWINVASKAIIIYYLITI